MEKTNCLMEEQVATELIKARIAPAWLMGWFVARKTFHAGEGSLRLFWKEFHVYFTTASLCISFFLLKIFFYTLEEDFFFPSEPYNVFIGIGSLVREKKTDFGIFVIELSAVMGSETSFTMNFGGKFKANPFGKEINNSLFSWYWNSETKSFRGSFLYTNLLINK